MGQLEVSSHSEYLRIDKLGRYHSLLSEPIDSPNSGNIRDVHLHWSILPSMDCYSISYCWNWREFLLSQSLCPDNLDFDLWSSYHYAQFSRGHFDLSRYTCSYSYHSLSRIDVTNNLVGVMDGRRSDAIPARHLDVQFHKIRDLCCRVVVPKETSASIVPILENNPEFQDDDDFERRLNGHTIGGDRKQNSSVQDRLHVIYVTTDSGCE